ncbi:MAG: LLM class flavin-dependent oxidoreductase [Alphaproteobacteria bacterium]|nr:LLM class flavin-dependent oxidoreductase [Alphaproteobacteria bacterium]
MDYSINLATEAVSWETVVRAEAAGFHAAWFYDTQLLNAEVFVAMTAAAMKTHRIRLGTGVLIPSGRIPPVTASALASLNRLAPGRIDFGISTGFTGRRTMGVGAIKLAAMEDYIRIVRGLLAGETVAWDYEGAPRKIRFLNPELGIINIADPIPLHVSALGPKGRRLTARLGAAWMNTVRDVEKAVADMADMKTAWRDAGRDPNTLYATAVVGGAVLRPGEDYDSPRIRAEAGPQAAIAFHNLVEAAEFGTIGGMTVPPPLQAAFDRYRAIYERYTPADARYLTNHKGHLMVLRPEEEAVVTPELIRMLSFSGTVEELRVKIRRLRDAGYTQFSAHIRFRQPAMLDDWAEVVKGV